MFIELIKMAYLPMTNQSNVLLWVTSWQNEAANILIAGLFNQTLYNDILFQMTRFLSN